MYDLFVDTKRERLNDSIDIYQSLFKLKFSVIWGHTWTRFLREYLKIDIKWIPWTKLHNTSYLEDQQRFNQNFVVSENTQGFLHLNLLCMFCV